MSLKSNLDPSPTSRAFTFLTVFWLVAVAGVMAVMIGYSNIPGHATMASNTLPAGSGIFLAAGQPSLILFAHPRWGPWRPAKWVGR
jgi:hypothetical protein